MYYLSSLKVAIYDMYIFPNATEIIELLTFKKLELLPNLSYFI